MPGWSMKPTRVARSQLKTSVPGGLSSWALWEPSDGGPSDGGRVTIWQCWDMPKKHFPS